MKWQKGRRSGNIEDRRGMSGGKKVAFGGIGGVVILLIAYFMGGDPSQILNQFEQQQSGQLTEQQEIISTPEEDRLIEFADAILTSTEDIWTKLFSEQNLNYPLTTLAIYRGGTETEGCGFGKAQYGPFYCPADQKIYLDLTFNQELKDNFGAKGEFALAYVIAHEVGHHIQNVLGILNKTNELRQRMSEREYNKISIMTELQADYYAGVWAHYLNEYTEIEIDYNDILDGMQAAEAVGDDMIQRRAQGHANPETFTHGTSAQRVYWFKKGYDSGDMKAGDTFNEPSLQ